MSKKIELKLPSETVMAEDLGNNTAKISILTMSPEYSYGDIVMYNDKKEVTFVVKKETNSGNIKYAFRLNNAAGTATKIMNHFKEIDGVKCEPIVPGFILIAYPVGIPEFVIMEHAKKCPEEVELELSEGEEL